MADAPPPTGEALILFNRAVFHHGRNEFPDAVTLYQQVVALRPDLAPVRNNLAVALRDLGRITDSLACCRAAIALKPDYAQAYNNLGTALQALNPVPATPATTGTDAARTAYRRAITLIPDYAQAYNNLGNVLRESDQTEQAAAALRRAITLMPDLPEAYDNLATTTLDAGAFDTAVAICRRSTLVRPGHAESFSDLGMALQSSGHPDAALTAYRQAVTLNPENTQIHFNRATALLQAGQYREGWAEYEWRRRTAIDVALARPYDQPEWTGDRLDGRTILLYTEQGFGDTLMWARFVPLVAAQGGSIVLQVYPLLARLMRGLPVDVDVVDLSPTDRHFDTHLPLMTLPHRLGIGLDNLPATVPYLRPDPAMATAWRVRLAGLSGLKVGLVWAGAARIGNRAANRIDRWRSIALARLAPLAAVPGIAWVSLQMGAAAAEAGMPPAGMTLLDWTEELTDFADTAALIDALDLVITVDTAVAHLAGALGKPVWILSRYNGCWRWLNDRDDSPWYPTARLFRQPRMGDWDTVITQVRDQLDHLALARQAARAAPAPRSTIPQP
ncbi:MAG: tetratricopeptide repeat-containing glycosyltransferase family protein [Azospirillaceae bacterium]|nr:tetratricopeptide repeat-containing glycosyltransferase family protein [Azospirillaceae bacterium]